MTDVTYNTNLQRAQNQLNTQNTSSSTTATAPTYQGEWEPIHQLDGEPTDGFDPQLINKFGNTQPGTVAGVDQTVQGDVEAQLASAGLPVPPAGQLNQASQQAAQNPAYARLKGLLRESMSTPGGVQKNAAAIASAAKEVGAGGNVNVWALVTQALMAAAQGNRDDQNYQLKKLQLYGNMQKQMSEYSNILTQKQHELDAAIGTDGKNTNAQIPFNEQRSFENFETLDSSGKIVSTSTASGARVEGNSLQKDGDGDFQLQDDGRYRVTFNLPQTFIDSLEGKDKTRSKISGNKVDGYGRNEQEARADAASHINGYTDRKNQSNGGNGKDSMISANGLQAELQHFNQQLDQLGNKISQGQNTLNQMMQTEQQNYSMITSVLKTMYEGLSGITRNLL